MMTDMEMLELAAKAVVDESWHGNESYMRGFMSTWNPLTDDGDALRLAVKLKIDLLFKDTSVETCSANNWFYEDDFGDDPISATRRIIVFAAAQIGAQM